MLLGELIEKLTILEDQISDIKTYLHNKDIDDSDYKVVINILYSCKFEYETCKEQVNSIINKIEVITADDKKTFLSNLFILKKAMVERIEVITYLLRNRCSNSEIFVSLMKDKKEYNKELLYICNFINKTIWNTNIDT